MSTVYREQPYPFCPCGFSSTHFYVSPVPIYSAFGYAILLLGATAEPVRVEYRCRRCGFVFESTDDPAVLKRAA